MNSTTKTSCTVVVTLLLLGGLASSVASKEKSKRDLANEAALRKATQRMHAAYARKLASAASLAVRKGLKKEAQELFARIVELDPKYSGRRALEKRLAKAADRPEGEDLEKAQKSLEKSLRRADQAHAKKMFSLAVACMKVGLFTRAYDLVKGVLDFDSNNSKARAVLGYKKDPKTKKWISAWQYNHQKKHFLTAEGWIPKKWKKKWDKGLRNYAGKWVSIAEEKRIRGRSPDVNPFRVESEHFDVRTNLGRERAWEFALLLEDYYRTFFRVFIGFFDQKNQAKLLFNKAKLKSKHVVLLFPSRVDYLTHVKQEHGNSELAKRSAGFYFSGVDRSSHFYWSANMNSVLATLYHEVTHQLFAETKPRAGGSQGNNWIVEGIATYVETWVKKDGKWLLGANIDAPEIAHARQFLAESPDWKLRDFITIDHEKFHKKEGRGLNYALSGAFSYFLMHYNDEQYKEDFVQLIKAYYEGKVREHSLPEYVMVPEASTEAEAIDILEKQFKEFMKNLGKEKPDAESDAELDAESDGSGEQEPTGKTAVGKKSKSKKSSKKKAKQESK